jgi:hypothetical protein
VTFGIIHSIIHKKKISTKETIKRITKHECCIHAPTWLLVNMSIRPLFSFLGAQFYVRKKKKKKKKVERGREYSSPNTE